MAGIGIYLLNKSLFYTFESKSWLLIYMHVNISYNYSLLERYNNCLSTPVVVFFCLEGEGKW